MLAALGVMGLVVYVVVGGRETPNPSTATGPASQAAPAVGFFPLSRERDAEKDAPAPSSANPALSMGTTMVPVLPQSARQRASAEPARTAAASTAIYGLAPSKPGVIQDEGGLVIEGPINAAPAPAPAPPERTKKHYITYGARSRRDIMVRARGKVLNATGGGSVKGAAKSDVRPQTFEASADVRKVQRQAAEQIDEVGRQLQASQAGGAIGAEAMATLDKAAKQLREQPVPESASPIQK